MIKYKHRILWVIGLTLYLALMAFLFTTAIGSFNNNENGTVQNKVTITFRHFWIQEYNIPVRRVMQDLVDEFEQEYPQYKIQFEEIDQSIHREQKLKSEMVTGTQPDLVVMFGGAEMEPYVRANRLLNLDDWLQQKELATRFKDLSLWTYEDSIYGLPFEGNAEPLFYNKELFQTLQLKPPTTLEELYTAVEVLKSNGYVPFALGNAERWQGAIFSHYLMDIYAGPEHFKAILEEKEFFDSYEYREAFNQLIRLGQMGAFPSNVKQLSSEAAIRMFVDGEAGMYLNGTWDIVMFQDEQSSQQFQHQVGVLPFPKLNAKDTHTSLSGGFTFGIGVSADLTEEEQEVALLFLEKIYQEETQQRLLYEAFRLPSMEISYDEKLTGPIFKQVIELIDQVQEEQQSMFVPYDNMLSPDVNEVFLDISSKLILGEISADHAIYLLNQSLK